MFFDPLKSLRENWDLAVIGVIATALVCMWLFGCVQPDAVRVEQLADDVAAVKAEIGQLTVGGGGDSITGWIQALGLVAAALVYPLIWRPIRRRLNCKDN